MQTVTEMAPRLGVAPTCDALALPRASYYRGQQLRPELKPRPTPARALSPEERAQVLATLHERVKPILSWNSLRLHRVITRPSASGVTDA